jgi:hypothetical protein
MFKAKIPGLLFAVSFIFVFWCVLLPQTAISSSVKVSANGFPAPVRDESISQYRDRLKKAGIKVRGESKKLSGEVSGYMDSIIFPTVEWNSVYPIGIKLLHLEGLLKGVQIGSQGKPGNEEREVKEGSRSGTLKIIRSQDGRLNGIEVLVYPKEETAETLSIKFIEKGSITVSDEYSWAN